MIGIVGGSSGSILQPLSINSGQMYTYITEDTMQRRFKEVV